MSFGIKEDRYAEEEVQAGRGRRQVIVAKLRQVDVLASQGASMADAIRQIGVSEVTFYRRRQEFGGLKTEQVKRLKDLELENSRLRKAVSDLTLDKLILTEAANGNFEAPRVVAPASSMSEGICTSPSAAPVRGQGASRMDCRCRRQDGLHRTGQSLGERLRRELQRAATGRTTQR